MGRRDGRRKGNRRPFLSPLTPSFYSCLGLPLPLIVQQIHPRRESVIPISSLIMPFSLPFSHYLALTLFVSLQPIASLPFLSLFRRPDERSNPTFNHRITSSPPSLSLPCKTMNMSNGQKGKKPSAKAGYVVIFE